MPESDVFSLGRIEFNKGQKLFLQNIPPVTHEDIRAYLKDIPVADIVISKRLKHAIVTLKKGESIDQAIASLRGQTLRGIYVEPEIYPRRMMLCIEGIPQHYRRKELLQFLSQYGDTETIILSVTRTALITTLEYVPPDHLNEIIIHTGGVSRRYALVEFSHNRATLEQVQNEINGSSLEGNTLYCTLIQDSVRGYEDTHSTILYTIVNSTQPEHPDPRLAKIIRESYHYPLSDDRQLCIIECGDSETADTLWTLISDHPSRASKESSIRFAMPGLSQAQISHIMSSTQRKFPSSDNRHEIHYLLMEMFPGNIDLIQSIEQLLEQVRSRLVEKQVTPEIILNIVSLLNMNNDCNKKAMAPQSSGQRTSLNGRPITRSFVMPDVSRPPPGFVQQRSPVTRSRSKMVCDSLNSLIASECSKRSALQMTACEELPAPCMNNLCMPDTGNGCTMDSLYEERKSSTGPVTRLKRHTLEKNLTAPYRKTPGTKGSRSSLEKERKVLFEVNLNAAMNQLVNCKRNLKSTPQVLRRLLPDPEPSPESAIFIGQHSQGIGGHYADNYQGLFSDIKKKLW